MSAPILKSFIPFGFGLIWNFLTNFENCPPNATSQKSTWLAKISPDKPEIENFPLIHLPIYNKIFFSGSSDEKNFFAPKPALGAKTFFRRMTPKKNFYYILVNGLMANFQFRCCRAKFWQIKLIFERLRWVGSSQNLSKSFKFIQT